MPRTAFSEEIKTRYRRLAVRCYLDKVSDPNLKDEATKKFSEIATAYKVLTDLAERQVYDTQGDRKYTRSLAKVSFEDARHRFNNDNLKRSRGDLGNFEEDLIS